MPSQRKTIKMAKTYTIIECLLPTRAYQLPYKRKKNMIVVTLVTEIFEVLL